MTGWEYEYDASADQSTIRWVGSDTTVSDTISGEITSWQSGFPTDDAAREAVASLIQNAGTPERIRMQFDFNYGFKRV